MCKADAAMITMSIYRQVHISYKLSSRSNSVKSFKEPLISEI